MVFAAFSAASSCVRPSFLSASGTDLSALSAAISFLICSGGSVNFLVCASMHTSLPPPALRERRHRRLAVRGVAVGRRAVLVVPEGQCPHPRRADRRRIGLEDAADNLAIGEHVVIIVTPLAGRTRGRCAFEDEIVLFHWG